MSKQDHTVRNKKAALEDIEIRGGDADKDEIFSYETVEDEVDDDDIERRDDNLASKDHNSGSV